MGSLEGNEIWLSPTTKNLTPILGTVHTLHSDTDYPEIPEIWRRIKWPWPSFTTVKKPEIVDSNVDETWNLQVTKVSPLGRTPGKSFAFMLESGWLQHFSGGTTFSVRLNHIAVF